MSQHDDENLQNSNTEEQDPCDDISIPPPPDPCIENPGAPGCPDSTGGEIAIEEVFFPAPENTIRATPQEAVASVSREITVINRPLFLDIGLRSTNPNVYSTNYGFADTTPFKVDNIRNILGKYWFWLGESAQVYDKDGEFNFVDSRNLGYEIFTKSYNAPESYSNWTSIIEIFYPHDRSDDVQIERSRSSIQKAVEGRVTTLMNPSDPSDRSNRQHPLYDHVFAAPQPFFKNETNNIGVPSSTIVSVTPKVNFYEEREPIPETQMQNLYRAYYKFVNPESNSDTPGSCTTDDVNQKFVSENVKVMKEANDTLKGQFNQYVEISINTEQSGKVAGLAAEFKMDKYFLEIMSSTTDPEPGFERLQLVSSSLYSFIQDERREYYTGFSVGGAPPINYYDAMGIDEPAVINDRVVVSGSATTTLVDPLYNIIAGIKDRPNSFFSNLNHKQYPLKYEYFGQTGALRFTDVIRSQIFMNKMEEQVLIKENIRSIGDIFNGVKSHSEVVGYRISKHEVVEQASPSGEKTTFINEEPIQNFYISDSNETLDIQFVDVQVNPGKTYAYRIHTINLVIGALYQYDNAGPENYETIFKQREDLYVWQIRATVEPDIKLIEAPFYEEIVTISEKPPIAPQVSFVPIQGVDNKMEILLQSNFDSEIETPIAIFSDDDQRIARMIASQPARDDGKLQYSTDSVPEIFQVLRMDTPPESYQQFASAAKVTNLSLTGRTYLFRDEEFQPNKDYYYCFRTIDKIGVSNPSFVFKVRLNSYPNGIYLTAREYEMVPLESTGFPLSFQRALKIEPSFAQRALKFPDANIESREFALSVPALNIDNIGNVPDEDTIWNRKFKVRITSKNSCKKIDVNLDFSKKVIKIIPMEEQEVQEIPCPDTNFGNLGTIGRHRILSDPSTNDDS
tara:strand:+ start:1737 stop:4457 length:2721 start_codon:yes stop_codon:yes gene_type:complete